MILLCRQNSSFLGKLNTLRLLITLISVVVCCWIYLLISCCLFQYLCKRIGFVKDETQCRFFYETLKQVINLCSSLNLNNRKSQNLGYEIGPKMLCHSVTSTSGEIKREYQPLSFDLEFLEIHYMWMSHKFLRLFGPSFENKIFFQKLTTIAILLWLQESLPQSTTIATGTP